MNKKEIISIDDIKKTLKDFIKQNYLYDSEEDLFTDEKSFIEEGIIDSTGILELIEFLEETYGIAVEDTEALPENLGSLNNVCAFVIRKRGSGNQ